MNRRLQGEEKGKRVPGPRSSTGKGLGEKGLGSGRPVWLSGESEGKCGLE